MNALAAIALTLSATSAFNETFDRATEAYNVRDYVSAIQMYEQLVDEGVQHSAVFHNLGNAYYRIGRLGAAIANYERALHCDPGLDSAAQNLAQSVRSTERRLARPSAAAWHQRLSVWQAGLSPRATYVAALTFWLAFWVLLGVRQWRPFRYLRRAAVLAGLLAVMFGVSAWAKAHPPLLAVADQERVAARFGTGETEAVRFELYQGDRVLVDRRSSGWSRVTTANGERGWARDADLAFVGPPYERPRVPESAVPQGAPTSLKPSAALQETGPHLEASS